MAHNDHLLAKIAQILERDLGEPSVDAEGRSKQREITLETMRSDRKIAGHAFLVRALVTAWNTGESLFPSAILAVIVERLQFPLPYLKTFLLYVGEDAPSLHLNDLAMYYADSSSLSALVLRVEEATRPFKAGEMKTFLRALDLADQVASGKGEVEAEAEAKVELEIEKPGPSGAKESKRVKRPEISYEPGELPAGLAGRGIDELKELFQRRLSASLVAPRPPHIILNKLSAIPVEIPRLVSSDFSISGERLKILVQAEIKSIEGLEVKMSDKELLDLIQVIDKAPQEERKNLEANLRPLFILRKVEELLSSTLLHRLFGPVNPDPSEEYTKLSDDNAYGGPRMLLDASFDITDEQEDWFTGECAVCFRRLFSRRYACRLPILGGGWRGCYCSWEHVKEEALRIYQEGDVEKQEIHLTLINRFIERAIEIGIFARFLADDPFEVVEEVVEEVEVPDKPKLGEVKKA
jgi:hypothetical protein